MRPGDLVVTLTLPPSYEQADDALERARDRVTEIRHMQIVAGALWPWRLPALTADGRPVAAALRAKAR